MNFHKIASAAEDLARVVETAGSRLESYDARPHASIDLHGRNSFIGYHLVAHLMYGIKSIEDADEVADNLLESLGEAYLTDSVDVIPRVAGTWPNGVTFFLFLGSHIRVPEVAA